MNPSHMIQTHESQAALNKSFDKLRELAFIDYTKLATINDAIDAEMHKLKQQYANTDTPEGAAQVNLRRTIAKNSAGAFSQLPDSGLDVVALKRERDHQTCVTIPKDQLMILRILHGQDEGKIAHAYRETQRLVKEGKL